MYYVLSSLLGSVHKQVCIKVMLWGLGGAHDVMILLQELIAQPIVAAPQSYLAKSHNSTVAPEIYTEQTDPLLPISGTWFFFFLFFLVAF